MTSVDKSYESISEVLVTVILGGLALFVGYRNLTERKRLKVSALHIYPVKSCGEISLQQGKATVLGFELDRIFQVSETTAEGQYCTPRDRKYARLFHIQPTLKDEKTLVLTAPDVKQSITISLEKKKRVSKQATPMIGPKVTLDDYGSNVSAWLGTVLGLPKNSVSLLGIGKDFKRFVEVNPDQKEELPSSEKSYRVSLADEAPYLLTSSSSLADLNKRLKARGKNPVDMRRFRPNIVVDGLPAWKEDTWKRIRIGKAEFHVWQRCGRCAMTTIDRDSLDRGPEPLDTLSTFRERESGQRNFGMHLIPVASTCPAIIQLGDDVQVLEYDAERQAEWNKLFGEKAK